MKKTGLFLATLLIGLGSFSYGQKMQVLEGNCDFLKNEKVINIEYDYSEMSVGKFETEEGYVDKKVAEHNEKEAGKGDKWKASWEGSRQRVYHPKFEQLFNKVLAKRGLSAAQDATDAKYTLIVKTTFLEPGFNIGIVKKAAATNLEYIFVETESKNVVAKFSQNGIPGAQAMGMDFDGSTRISESYAKGGKMLAGFIYKKLK